MKRTRTTQILLRILPLVVLAVTLAALYLHYQQIAGLKKKAFESLLLKSELAPLSWTLYAHSFSYFSGDW